MAISVEVGVFAKDSSGVDGATQDVTTGFQPKAVIFWGEYNTTSAGDAGGTAYYGISFSDGTNHRGMGCANEDAVGDSDTGRAQRNNVLVFVTETQAYLAYGTVAFAATKFTITWTENTNTTATQVHYMIFGGTDITGVEAGTITSPTTAQTSSYTTGAAVQSISEGFGVVFFISQANATIPPIASTTDLISFGAATGVNDEFAVGHESDEVAAQSEVTESYTNAGCVRAGFNDLDFLAGNFAGFDSAGFDIQWTTVPASARYVFYLAIKGGQWKAGTDSASTTVTTKATTTPFQPKGLLSASTRLTSSTVNGTTDKSCDIGATDGTNQGTATATDDDNQATMIIGRASSTTKCVRILNPSGGETPTVSSEAAFSSFNATNFTLNWTTADGTAYLFGWVVCGDEAGSAGFAHSYGVIIG